MKASEVNIVIGILAGMKLNKIQDKDTKNALVLDYIALRKASKEMNADVQEIIAKFQEDWKEAIVPVRELRAKQLPVEGYDDFLEAEKDANATIETILNKELELDIKTVTLEDFVTAAGDEDLSLEQLAILQDCGLIE